MSGRIERIVVPFDATSETRGAIAVAARLAAHAKVQPPAPDRDLPVTHLRRARPPLPIEGL